MKVNGRRIYRTVDRAGAHRARFILRFRIRVFEIYTRTHRCADEIPRVKFARNKETPVCVDSRGLLENVPPWNVLMNTSRAWYFMREFLKFHRTCQLDIIWKRGEIVRGKLFSRLSIVSNILCISAVLKYREVTRLSKRYRKAKRSSSKLCFIQTISLTYDTLGINFHRPLASIRFAYFLFFNDSFYHDITHQRLRVKSWTLRGMPIIEPTCFPFPFPLARSLWNDEIIIHSKFAGPLMVKRKWPFVR